MNLARRILRNEIVELLVGPQKELLRVHKLLLCNKVPYFAKMFQGGFKDAKESRASFPEDTAESFGLLIEWIYTGIVRPLGYKTTGPRHHTYDMVAFYVLAENICAFDLADNILEAYRVHQVTKNKHPAIWCTKHAYNKTEAGSPLRRYCAGSLIYVFVTNKVVPNPWPTKELSDLMGDVEDFRKDFLFRLRTVSVSPPVHLTDPRYAHICDYHWHGKTDVCPVKKAS